MPEPWTPLDPASSLAYLVSSCDTFARTVGGGDLSAPVPGCPGWDLADLADHLGNVHRWVVGAIVEGHPDTEEVPHPVQRAELQAWYRDCADGLLAVLRAAGPDQACWAFGPRPHTTRFWFRRQAQETAVHTRDAQESQGAVVPLEPVLALDGVDEVVGMFFPRQVRLGRTPALTRSLALIPTDAVAVTGRELCWTLAGDGTGSGATVTGPDPTAAATLSGPAESLLLALWKRLPPDAPGLELTGDPDAAREVLSHALTP